MGEEDRLSALRDIGRGFVAAACAVEYARGQRGAHDTAQWNAFSADMQRIAGQGVLAGDARAVNDGIRIKTGRIFLPEVLGILTGGLLGIVGAAAQKPIRITADMLDDGGKFLGQSSGGLNAPNFRNWTAKTDNAVEIKPGGQIRYTTSIGLVAVWCRSFDSVMCSKGDEPCAQSGRMNFARMLCGSR